MKDQDIINQITHQLKQLKSDSSTQAGPVDQDVLLATNEAFESFRVNYHNQFLKAYPDLETLNFAKRLWINHLQEFDGPRIRIAAQKVISQSDFLPTIHSFLTTLKDPSAYGLPDSHSAYMEACRAPKPKSEYNWSHPAIYYAGLASDWFFLETEIESRVFPIFKHNYELLCERVIKGEKIDAPVHKALPAEVSIPLSKKDNQEKLKALREKFDL